MTRKYEKVSDDERQRLIKLIQNDGQTIKQAAIQIGIPYENAKAIHRVYRKEQRTVKRSTRQRFKVRGVQDKNQKDGYSSLNALLSISLNQGMLNPAAPNRGLSNLLATELQKQELNAFSAQTQMKTPGKLNFSNPILTNLLKQFQRQEYQQGNPINSQTTKELIETKTGQYAVPLVKQETDQFKNLNDGNFKHGQTIFAKSRLTLNPSVTGLLMPMPKLNQPSNHFSIESNMPMLQSREFNLQSSSFRPNNFEGQPQQKTSLQSLKQPNLFSNINLDTGATYTALQSGKKVSQQFQLHKNLIFNKNQFQKSPLIDTKSQKNEDSSSSSISGSEDSIMNNEVEKEIYSAVQMEELAKRSSGGNHHQQLPYILRNISNNIMGDSGDHPRHQISKGMELPAVAPVVSYLEQLKEVQQFQEQLFKFPDTDNILRSAKQEQQVFLTAIVDLIKLIAGKMGEEREGRKPEKLKFKVDFQAYNTNNFKFRRNKLIPMPLSVVNRVFKSDNLAFAQNAQLL